MLLGVIADDFTGGSDIANTLAKGGMAVTQFVGIPSRKASADCEAGVVSLKSRTIPAAGAVAQSLSACDWLLAQGCRQILFKYCSTFDSTPEGNIGPVAEALLDKLGGSAVVCPVFPATGRTLYNGHLFVGDRLLSETGMRDHPLTPMSDPDIRRWLRRQTKGEIGLVPFQTVRQGSAAIRAALNTEAKSGRRLIVTDALSDSDLRAIGEAIAGDKLITGGSGIALGLPENFMKSGLIEGRGGAFRGFSGGGVALSGSCSAQSLKQVAAFAKTHPTLALRPDAVMDKSQTVPDVTRWVLDHLDQGPMVYSSADPAVVREAQNRHGRDKVAGAIEAFMADIARNIIQAGVMRLVVGGGETSGAVVSALGVSHLAIGPEIDPGVPVLSADNQAFGLVLKSGNFGSEDFYDKAFRALETPLL
ncbi:MAG: 3-oxo-tetronate kinase [Rhabdaerophilum sp.]